MLNFKDKNIVIVGASSGIGYTLAQLLHEAGANIFSVSRSEPDVTVSQHINLDMMAFDADKLADLPKEIHGLAYCPGSIVLKPFARLSDEQFIDDFNLNVLGAVRIVRTLLPKLKKAKGSQVLFFSTVAAKVGMNFHASIATAKGAVEGLAKSLAAEFAASQIRVNTIAPSLTDTPLAANLLSSDDRKEKSAKRHPLGRYGESQDIASLGAYLLSDQASWMSGQVIGVDGGMAALRTF